MTSGVGLLVLLASTEFLCLDRFLGKPESSSAIDAIPLDPPVGVADLPGSDSREAPKPRRKQRVTLAQTVPDIMPPRHAGWHFGQTRLGCWPADEPDAYGNLRVSGGQGAAADGSAADRAAAAVRDAWTSRIQIGAPCAESELRRGFELFGQSLLKTGPPRV